eukprot:gene25987-34587_t
MNPEQVDKTVSSDDATSIWRQFKVVGVEDDASIASTSSCFFDWEHIYPQLKLLLENIDIIKQEAKSIPKWVPWPEDHFKISNSYSNKDWTVFPLLHTFPADNTDKMAWIGSTTAICPETSNLLRQLLPNIRTALFSKLGPQTELSNHTGWADLANHVLRLDLLRPPTVPFGTATGSHTAELDNFVSRFN